MRKALFFILAGLLTLSIPAFAKPEQIRIKTRQHEALQEKSSKKDLKNLELSRIQDPEARKAIREIVAYLSTTAGK